MIAVMVVVVAGVGVMVITIFEKYWQLLTGCLNE